MQASDTVSSFHPPTATYLALMHALQAAAVQTYARGLGALSCTHCTLKAVSCWVLNFASCYYCVIINIGSRIVSNVYHALLTISKKRTPNRQLARQVIKKFSNFPSSSSPHEIKECGMCYLRCLAITTTMQSSAWSLHHCQCQPSSPGLDLCVVSFHWYGLQFVARTLLRSLGANSYSEMVRLGWSFPNSQCEVHK